MLEIVKRGRGTTKCKDLAAPGETDNLMGPGPPSVNNVRIKK